MTPEFFRNSDKKNTINYFSTFPVRNCRRSRRNRNFWGIFEEYLKNSEKILVWKAADFPISFFWFYILPSLQTFFSQSDNFQIEVSIHLILSWWQKQFSKLTFICELLNPYVKSLRVPIKVRSRFQFQVWHFNYVKLWLNTDKKYSKLQNKIQTKDHKSMVLFNISFYVKIQLNLFVMIFFHEYQI